MLLHDALLGRQQYALVKYYFTLLLQKESMRIRILTLFFITSTLAGCGATRTINDTEYGVWNYYENDDSDGYTDLELEYVALYTKDGKELYKASAEHSPNIQSSLVTISFC